MGPIQYMLAILLLCLAIDRSHGYALRGRSWDSDNTLADALRVIDKEKRRLVEEGYGDERPMERPYYWEQPRDTQNNVEEAEMQFLNDLFASPDSESEYLEESEPNVYQIEEDKIANEVLEPQYQPQSKRSEVNKEELEDIFQPESAQEGDGKQSVAQLDDGEVRHLLDTIEATEAEVLSKNNHGGEAEAEEDEKEEVSEDELEDILGPDGEENVKEVVHDVKEEEDEEEEEPVEEAQKGEEEWPEEMNKEWLVSQYMEGMPNSVKSVKKKRSDLSAQAPIEFEEPEMAEEEEEEDSLDLALLKEYLSLEDDENTNLAMALNQATKAQISSRPDQFIPEEIELLQKAITDEEEIQRLRGLLQEATDSEPEETEPRQEPYYYPQETERYRSDKRAPLSDLQDEGDLEEEEQDEDLLAEKLKEYLFKVAAGGYDEEQSQNDVASQDDTWYKGPIPDQEEGISDEELELNPFLRELLQKYRSGRMGKRGDGRNYEDDFGEDEEVDNRLVPIQELYEEETCPAVTESTNNCAAARAMGLSLDEEAMDLCNRHQTCYNCGGAHGLAADDCDSGYLKEADLLCRDSEECKDEAAALFVIMLREHGYVSAEDTRYSCQAQCTFDYILGAGAI